MSCVEFVSPNPGDLVRIIQGPFTGFAGWLVDSYGSHHHLQLMNGTYAYVAANSVAKLAIEIGTPVATPTSPHPLPSPTSPSTPTATSPFLSPASLPNGQFPGFPCPSSYSPSPPGYINGFTTVTSPHRATPAYLHAPYPRNLRRPLTACPNGAIRTPLSNPAMSDHFHRRRLVIQQQRDATVAQQQCRPTLALRGNALNTSRNLQPITGSSSGGKTVRGDHEYKAHLMYLETPTQDILEEVRGGKTMEYDFGSTGDGGDLSSNCIQVPLICPLSQRRMTLPCRSECMYV
jgi:hypothetical protein